MLASPVRAYFRGCFGSSHPARAAMPFHNSSSERWAGAPSSMAVSTLGETQTDVGPLSVEEWQGWGTSSVVPAMVEEVIEGMRCLERDTDARMTFGGIGGKLQGAFKAQEDKKHRAVYQSLADSEQKLQFFSARQIACRLLGSRGYLCQKCWLPMEDCMCSELEQCSLWNGIRFWLYMHPKDFLRQNNTGKLLWQLFGIQAASLCLFGIHEHEEVMWDAFRHSGKSMVWFAYPNKNATQRSIQDVLVNKSFTTPEDQAMDLGESPLNVVLIDGTWSNSAAMYGRLKAKWTLLWGDEDLPCITLSTLTASVMHKLRPQPAWDRTCTAAAAAGLLSDLHLNPEYSMHGLDKQAEVIEKSLDILLNALTARRVRMGRSITRRERRHLN